MPDATTTGEEPRSGPVPEDDGEDAAAGGDGTGGDAPRLAAGPTVTRRRFAAGAGAALLLPVAAGLAPWRTGRPARPDASGDRRTPPVPDGGAAAPAQQGEEEPPGTGALVDYVEARWGDRLSADDLEQVRSAVAGNLRAASSIGEVPLENGDGPGFFFRPYRRDGG